MSSVCARYFLFSRANYLSSLLLGFVSFQCSRHYRLPVFIISPAINSKFDDSAYLLPNIGSSPPLSVHFNVLFLFCSGRIISRHSVPLCFTLRTCLESHPCVSLLVHHPVWSSGLWLNVDSIPSFENAVITNFTGILSIWLKNGSVLRPFFVGFCHCWAGRQELS